MTREIDEVGEVSEEEQTLLDSRVIEIATGSSNNSGAGIIQQQFSQTVQLAGSR